MSKPFSTQAIVIHTQPLQDEQAKWIGLTSIDWIDPHGQERKWESADRKTRKGEIDAVAILAMIYRPSSLPHILLISQFRPAVGKSCIELPAGLVDEGEQVEQAALRELKEETGYRINSLGGGGGGGGDDDSMETTNTMFNDPGLTGSNMKLCMVQIHLTDDAADPIAQPEEGECIEKYLVPIKHLSQQLQEFQNKGYAVDARLAHLAIGLNLGLGKWGNL